MSARVTSRRPLHRVAIASRCAEDFPAGLPELTLYVCPTCHREALMFPSPSPALCPHPGTPHDREDPTPFTQADKEKST